MAQKIRKDPYWKCNECTDGVLFDRLKATSKKNIPKSMQGHVAVVHDDEDNWEAYVGEKTYKYRMYTSKAKPAKDKAKSTQKIAAAIIAAAKDALAKAKATSEAAEKQGRDQEDEDEDEATEAQNDDQDEEPAKSKEKDQIQ